MKAGGDFSGTAESLDVLLPFGVRDAIRQHIARLSDDDRPIIETASVLGSEVRPALLAAASSLPVSDVQAVLDRAARIGILVERGHHRYGFGHGLICEALYRDLANSRRMELHARVGQALLDSARAELGLAESLVRARLGDTTRGRALCLRAATLARGLGDTELFARIALGYGAEFAFGLVDRQLVDLLREALAGLPAADSPLRARVMARLAAALQPADHPEEQVEAERAAIRMARRIGHKPTLLAVLHAGMGAMINGADPVCLVARPAIW